MNNIKKARMLVEMDLLHVLQRDKEGRIKSVLVPGTDGKQYMVILKRDSLGFNVECQLQAGTMGHVGFCKSGNLMCYHGLAAVMLALKDMGLGFYVWRGNRRVKYNYQQEGRKRIFQIRKRQSDAVPVRFAVFTPKKEGVS